MMTRASAIGRAIESLRWTRNKFVSYNNYPSEEFRAEQIAEINEAMTVLKKMQDQLTKRRLPKPTIS